MLAQSIGGGGGFVLTNNASTSGASPAAIENIRVGGTGSAQSNGGAVDVTVGSVINTGVTINGDPISANSIGIVAQSIGGGGGMVISESGVEAHSGKGGGEGGAVTVNVNSKISVDGGSVDNAVITNRTIPMAYGVYAKINWNKGSYRDCCKGRVHRRLRWCCCDFDRWSAELRPQLWLYWCARLQN